MTRDTFCAYYTNSNEITSYMTAKLEIRNSDVILEPSAGEGIFIDEILKKNALVRIDAIDINRNAVNVLKEKYRNNPSVCVRETDTLFDRQLDMYSCFQFWQTDADAMTDGQLNMFAFTGGYYDKVIGNPPYGAWQDYERRDLLKKKYAGQYVKETYSLFLLRCLSVLKRHGRLVFIIPDTFLFLNMHARLREILLKKSKIDEILIFPSKFFPGISFGYSNLSIITLERCEGEEALKNTIRIIRGFKSPEEFKDILYGNYSSLLEIFEVKQKDVLKNPQSRFLLADKRTEKFLRKPVCVLGDVANVVTGFYTGDNLTFIKALNKEVRGAGKYNIVDPKQIFKCTSTAGIHDVEEGYIPYIKSASDTRYYRGRDEWFVRWDEKTIEYYNNNKKSRFQNSEYYFRTGIGIPMVKSKTIRAFLMEDRVFDQSIVGIFPKDSNKLLYLLGLMNSDIINNLIHLINPTANNSSNYIKLIPYAEPDEASYLRVVFLVKEILNIEKKSPSEETDILQREINSIIDDTYAAIV